MYALSKPTESTPLLSRVTRRFNKFKSGVKGLKDVHRKEHPITEISQVNIEGFGLISTFDVLSVSVLGVLRVK